LPEYSTIDNNILKSSVDDTHDHTVPCIPHKLFHLETQHTLSSDSMTGCTIKSTIVDDDSVGNTSIDSIELYEVFDDDIEYCFHGPKIIPQNKTPATICTVNTICAKRSRQLFCMILDSGASCFTIKKSSLPQGAVLQDLSVSKNIKTLSGQVMVTYGQWMRIKLKMKSEMKM
jgi:hypothetical protein